VSRREDGFRVADRHQVRIEALEKKLRRAIEERDAARAGENTAKRLALTLGKSLEDAQHAAVMADQRAAAARASLEAVLAETRRELAQMRTRLQAELEEIERGTIRARLGRLVARWRQA
jgi:hypothetical protein